MLQIKNICKQYKTGDLVKWNSDGNISFIGREDFQIKINGHRIELGEIENCIYLYPNIDKATITIDKQIIRVSGTMYYGTAYICIW